ncbi:DHA2 family efflux MFS transporter permease subunit [Ornithinimicrobium ciconiae]|uniref:DHA2 family efflux MFS transporter permease subunit n=1 Tax=Ornithinimicrobium ciconiae TaxID=2594265 RepID=A0A516GCS9_9MICO|nr:MDR family MFS transporter [Ornithinimicrobium ciconiae]QDO89335.1 DHA2 family efflux MFS transporter permease subunit [Ornithinimicrobium ciconiae]
MTAPSPLTGPTAYTMTPEHRRVFIGLMLGMFVASISQTIVGPAMPRIVAELGGMEHYSWVATAAMLVSAIAVPIVGKLSDMFGRREFYLGGLVIFMVGSVISGLAPNFWTLVAGRAVQGLGMGTLMPLSQTIIGDIIPARQRGKYQGLMGAVFGVTSVAGPLAGGFITDAWGWRWLFFAALPVGIVGVFIIARFLKLEHTGTPGKIDVLGIMTLTPALVAILLATSWAGSTYSWDSPVILGLFAVGTVLLALFVLVEARAQNPLLPLGMFRNGIVTYSSIAAFGMAMVMFGAIIYVPVFAQGVLGVNATESGLILMPMMLGLIVVGIVAGFLITRTGRYKEIMLLGVVVIALGLWMLTRLGVDSSEWELTAAIAVMGTGLGLAMQQYTLVVQNAVPRSALGVGTAALQFFRNVGNTVGIAIFGSVMTAGLAGAIASHLPADFADEAGDLEGIDAGAALDPAAMAGLPPEVLAAIRAGLSDQLHDVFLLGLPIMVVVFLATLGIRAIPLRETVHTPDEAQREYLDTMAHSAPSENYVPSLRHGDVGARTRERVLGIELALLARLAGQDDRPFLTRAVAELGEGDLERGRTLLRQASLMLTSADDQEVAQAERYAVALGQRAGAAGGLLSEQLRQDLAVRAAERSRAEVLSSIETSVAERHTAVDLSQVRQAASELATALLVDLAPEPED